MAEKIFDAQSNYGWGLSLNMTGKAPAIAKRIWGTYNDAKEYVDNVNDSAIEGLILSVVDDEDGKNGVYFVASVGKNVLEYHDVLDENGDPKTDPETGEVEKEEVSVHYPGELEKLSDASNFDTAVLNAKAYTDEKFETLANALHFLGISTTDPSKGSLTIGGNVYTKELKAGDIVIFGAKEFVYDGSKWEELGDITGVSELLTWNEVTPAPESGEEEV